MKVAISGLGSAGTTSTAKLVSERMGLEISTYTLRDLAEDRGISLEEMHHRAKKQDPTIDYDLDREHIKFINSHPNVLVASDLSCWLDDPKIYKKVGLEEGAKFDLKIWLDPSLEARAKRFSEREGGSLKRLKEYDEELREHYEQLYGIDFFDHSNIDWVFDTSEVPLEEVVNEICNRLK